MKSFKQVAKLYFMPVVFIYMLPRIYYEFYKEYMKEPDGREQE